MQPSAPPGIGTRLRDARVARGLSIEEAAWRTRIRPEMLRALEDESFDTIGHQAFVRSHLASYARFVGVDPAEVLGVFVERHEEPEASSIEQLDQRRRHARKPPRATWIIAAAISSALLIGAASIGLLGGQAEPAPEPAVAFDASGDRGSGRASRTDPDRGVVPAAEARVRVTVTAKRDTEVSVLADGTQVFSGILSAGARRTFYGATSVDLLASDAASITLAHNGRTLGVPGDAGTVYRARFGPRGQLRD